MWSRQASSPSDIPRSSARIIGFGFGGGMAEKSNSRYLLAGAPRTLDNATRFLRYSFIFNDMPLCLKSMTENERMISGVSS